MAIAITLEEYLQDKHISYEIIDHYRTDSTLQTCEVAHIPGDRMAKSVLLGDDDSYLMAVIPATHRVDIDHLNEITGRQLELIEEEELVEVFADCEPGAIPPIGETYGIDTLVDPSLIPQSEIYFETGDHTKVIHVSGTDFSDLVNETTAVSFTYHI